MAAGVDAQESRGLAIDFGLEAGNFPCHVADSGVEEGVIGVRACRKPAAEVSSHAVRVVAELLGSADAHDAI